MQHAGSTFRESEPDAEPEHEPNPKPEPSVMAPGLARSREAGRAVGGPHREFGDKSARACSACAWL